ncbi:MAG: BON domain-containing protein [Candidatus Protochlamydia sp.]|nr:BON domain-containing protein [Candidatus Protochlamydia sp.]
MKKVLFLFSAACLLLTSCENRTHAPDNTGRNARDRNTQALTAGEQPENEADRTVTAQVRRVIMEDDSLSTNGKNVKIITINGVVTLRGPVNSDREKNEIGRKAREVTGVKNVDNQLEVNTRGNENTGRGNENAGRNNETR